MPEPVIHQLSSFLLFLLGGLALGFLFDVLRALRTALRPRGLRSLALDLAYWLAALAIVLPLLAVGTWGDLRLFVWLALLLGAAYYFYLLSAICRPLARVLVGLVLAGLDWPKRAWHGAQFVRAELKRGGRRQRAKGNARRTRT